MEPKQGQGGGRVSESLATILQSNYLHKIRALLLGSEHCSPPNINRFRKSLVVGPTWPLEFKASWPRYSFALEDGIKTKELKCKLDFLGYAGYAASACHEHS